ncbi:Tropolone synthesis J [Hyphodiscus hymeniophilus]|uniref:Tropolone synthesis J n=1 Tax=Hyphodiscus hymeniophilus TaxID=353542 RepID=A0A9P7AX51_9HELO|nr:Tropolone synthesis J [Hyphodiscus hymeniophilus]
MSGDKAPALVSAPSDLIYYHVKDSSPVDPEVKKGYQERYIHSEIYKHFPEINSVVHSHSEAVLPFTMNGVPMKPAFHIAGFLGTEVPNFDIKPLYQDGDVQSMLVNSERFGSYLASKFSKSKMAQLDHNVVLMKNHGFTTVGKSIKQVVYRAVYTHVNANVQSNAIISRNAHLGTHTSVSSLATKTSGRLGDELIYLDEDQTLGCMQMNDSTQERPWGLWEREVEVCPLYVNKAKFQQER